MARTVNRMKPTQFRLHAPEAKRVTIAGSFNNWDTQLLTARRDSRGTWAAKVNLKPGKYEYKFFVDGTWANDPKCSQCTSNAFGSQNCVIEIK